MEICTLEMSGNAAPASEILGHELSPNIGTSSRPRNLESSLLQLFDRDFCFVGSQKLEESAPLGQGLIVHICCFHPSDDNAKMSFVSRGEIPLWTRHLRTPTRRRTLRWSAAVTSTSLGLSSRDGGGILLDKPRDVGGTPWQRAL